MNDKCSFSAAEVRSILGRLLCCGAPGVLGFTLEVGGRYRITFDGDFTMGMNVDGGPILCFVSIKDAHGNPAKIDGVPEWTNDREDVVTMVVDPADNLKATFTPVGLAGVATIGFKADADLGDGVKEITGVGTIDLAGGEAADIQLTFEQQGATQPVK